MKPRLKKKKITHYIHCSKSAEISMNQYFSYDLHCILPTEKIHLDKNPRAFSLKKKHNLHVTSIYSTRQNEHHLHYERRMPTRTITYNLFIKCYFMHFLSLTPSVQTNSTLPDRSIIIIKYIHDDIFHWHLYPRFHFFIKIGIQQIRILLKISHLSFKSKKKLVKLVIDIGREFQILGSWQNIVNFFKISTKVCG